MRSKESMNNLERDYRNLRQRDELIYCYSCEKVSDDMEGARQPDYEGGCPHCGEETNWTVINISDARDVIIAAHNEGDIDLDV